MLHFNGLEPIDFGGKECKVIADQELKLRIRAINGHIDSNDQLTDLLVQCFDDDYAKDFVRNKLSWDDKVVVAAYISGGETAVNRLSRATDGAIETYLERAIGNDEK